MTNQNHIFIKKMGIKIIYFDVAHTLLYKPQVYEEILNILHKHDFNHSLAHVKEIHKLVSEVFIFPDVTSESFYTEFNASLLYALGVIPNDAILKDLFFACKNLPWEKFPDTVILDKLNFPLGIISNWNSKLKEQLAKYFNIDLFENIIISEKERLRKPTSDFYDLLLKDGKYKPEEIIYLGDSLKLDIAPGLSKGIRSILVDRDNFFPFYTGEKINDLRELNNLIYG